MSRSSCCWVSPVIGLARNGPSSGATRTVRWSRGSYRQGPLRSNQQNTPKHILNIALSNNITSIELPAEIESLIVGSDYWRTAKRNRYKMLARQGHLSGLLKLAKIARTKNIPAHWFATVCSKVEWQRTLEYLAKLAKVQE